MRHFLLGRERLSVVLVSISGLALRDATDCIQPSVLSFPLCLMSRLRALSNSVRPPPIHRDVLRTDQFHGNSGACGFKACQLCVLHDTCCIWPYAHVCGLAPRGRADSDSSMRQFFSASHIPPVRLITLLPQVLSMVSTSLFAAPFPSHSVCCRCTVR